MNTAVVNTVATEVKWRKLNDQEKAAYGPHSMVVGFAECCPYCHAENLRVVWDSKDPNSPFVYLENHEPHPEDVATGYYSLCPGSKTTLQTLNTWMRGEDTYREMHVTRIPYAEFFTKRFPDTTVS